MTYPPEVGPGKMLDFRLKERKVLWTGQDNRNGVEALHQQRV